MDLPDELIREILFRLPVRCVLRLKCVSKSWFSLISDPEFAKSHFDLAVTPIDRLFLKICYDYKADSIDTEASSLNDDSAKVVFKIPNPLPVLIAKDGHWIDVAGSCRGFLLLTTPLPDFIYFLIWNPSTGFQRRFSNVSFNCSNKFGIGYDSSTDDYVVVIVTLGIATEIHCFSTRTNSWECIQSTISYINLGYKLEHGSFLNGALHWLVYCHNKRPIIIAFDVMEKKLSEIPLPHKLESLESPTYSSRLRVMGGCLCLYVEGLGIDLPELWMMKEYKVHSSWTKSFVLEANFYPFEKLSPICFTKNGEILVHDSCQTVMRLNDKGKLLDEHCSNDLFTRLCGSLQCGVYRESLLSLPSNFEKVTN